VPKIIYTDTYVKKAAKFIKRHPHILGQYEKTLRILEVNPSHPSLRLHKLKGTLSELYSVSINISYRIMLYFIVKEDAIIPVDIGTHDEVY
jgi:mRNA-degrading endonuclease YafQ of YafQ-DinJ toxin-antitoxin module